MTVQTGGIRAAEKSKAMLLALDVGNTNTKLGLYRLDGGEPALAAHWRLTTHRAQTVDEYGALFINLFQMKGLDPSQVKHIIISSVVPPVESTLRQMCEIYFQSNHCLWSRESRPAWLCCRIIRPIWAQTVWSTRLPLSNATAARASWLPSAPRPHSM